jgi:pyridoxine/pyridoxamine 5'-phosphate oxidase
MENYRTVPGPFCPETLVTLIRKSLEDLSRPAYGQVATVDLTGQPKVRTVHLRYIKERNTLGFSGNVKSPKWAHLRAKPALSGCFYDAHRHVQLRWEGGVELIDAKSRRAADHELLDRMWLLMRPDVRLAYWRDWLKDASASADVQKRCPSLGVIVCRPTVWDIFQIDPRDYNKDVRTIHTLKGTAWKARQVSALHGGKTH